MNIAVIMLWWLLFMPFAVWVGLLLLQAVCAMLPVPALLLAAARPRIAVLIPAHNEAAGIVRTLQSILPQLQSGDRLLVVADNCDDDTARVAAAAGAEVIERHDPQQRGKGYALDRGVRHLAKDAPEVVIVVDADCKMEAGAVDYLARASIANDRPVQALYLMQNSPLPVRERGRRRGGQLRGFAWIVRNLVRPLGYLRLGQPCQLMGTGMAFPWPLIAAAPLANAHLVEDMQLGIDLTRAGAAPLFCPQALVSSEFPAGETGARQQRRRWEHGHLGMIAGVPRLLIDAAKQRDGNLLALALDLSVPPLALLVLLLLAMTVLAAFTASAFALFAAPCLLALLAAALLLAWWRHGRGVLKLRTLLLAPLYALAKLPLYAGFLRRRQVEWVRSSRE